MASRTLDSAGSSVTIRTRAKGMLARFAHDLEIAASCLDAQVEVSEASWQATLVFPVNRLRVVGALKGGRVDASVLSSSDRDEIERKIRSEVLCGPEVVVNASGDTLQQGHAEVVAPRGRQRLAVRLSSREDNGATVAYGKLTLSLRALGIAEIKAPLGAFKVDDAVEVAFWMKLVPQ